MHAHLSLLPSCLERRELQWGKGAFPEISKCCKIWPTIYKGTMVFIIASLAKKTLRPLLPQNPNDIEKNTALQYLPVHPSVSSQLSH